MSWPINSAKKPKKYNFHDQWEEDYFFTHLQGKCVCLICHSSVALAKKSNVSRHHRTVHKYFDDDFQPGTELRKEKVRQLKSQLLSQQTLIKLLRKGDQEDTIENASGVEDNGELGFGYGMNPVAALEHSDTEPSGSANSFTVNKRQKLEHRVSTLKHAVNELKNRPMSHTNQSEENEFDIFGLYVSTSLKKLSLPRAFRLQEKINSLIAEERISYASQISPYSNNGMAAINHRSDNDDMDHSSESSYITDRQNDIKAEEIEIECVPEIRLSL